MSDRGLFVLTALAVLGSATLLARQVEAQRHARLRAQLPFPTNDSMHDKLKRSAKSNLDTSVTSQAVPF